MDKMHLNVFKKIAAEVAKEIGVNIKVEFADETGREYVVDKMLHNTHVIDVNNDINMVCIMFSDGCIFCTDEEFKSIKAKCDSKYDKTEEISDVVGLPTVVTSRMFEGLKEHKQYRPVGDDSYYLSIMYTKQGQVIVKVSGDKISLYNPVIEDYYNEWIEL